MLTDKHTHIHTYTCVHYVNNEATRFQTFVADRVATVREATTQSQWRYVDTHSNPADEASRGISADSLERWINGPNFLTQSDDEWPQQPAELDDPREEEMEFKKAKVCASTTIPQSPAISDQLFKRFSSWDRLKKIIAWILRYKANLRKSVKEKKLARSTIAVQFRSPTSPITVNEMNDAELEICKLVQEDNCGRHRWRQVQYLADVFWRRWIREYLPSLQPRQKWNEKCQNVKVGDIVLVVDEKTPRSSWPLARVSRVNANRKDGLVRSVKVRTSTAMLIRPISKIVLLELRSFNQ